MGRITTSRKKFEHGPFHLGAFTEPLGWICVVFILICFIALIFPYQATWDPVTFNYASFMIGGISILSMISWFVYEQFWYKGPGFGSVPPPYPVIINHLLHRKREKIFS